jgi:hypothetical protein
MLTGIASGLAVAVIVGALAWLRKTDHRDALMRSVRWVREHLCRGHEWEPIPPAQERGHPAHAVRGALSQGRRARLGMGAVVG